MGFEEVWHDIISIVNDDNTIITLSQRKLNTITEILPEGLMVTARGESKLVRKSWIEAAWNALQNDRKITANDIPGMARYRSSFIMALLSKLKYVKTEINPITLFLND